MAIRAAGSSADLLVRELESRSGQRSANNTAEDNKIRPGWCINRRKAIHRKPLSVLRMNRSFMQLESTESLLKKKRLRSIALNCEFQSRSGASDLQDKVF